MKLLEDYYTSSIWTFVNEGRVDTETVDQVFEELKIDREVFENGDDLGLADADLIKTMLNREYPAEDYFILIDCIPENIGSFHIRVWSKKMGETEQFMRIKWKNASALRPRHFEEIEHLIKRLLERNGFEAEIYNSVTGNEMTVLPEQGRQFSG